VWDLCEGQHIFSLPAEEIFWRDDLGDSVGFSRDSRTLAILGFDSVGLWEVPTGKKLESATARYTWRERRCLATDKAGNLLLVLRHGNVWMLRNVSGNEALDAEWSRTGWGFSEEDGFEVLPGGILIRERGGNARVWELPSLEGLPAITVTDPG